MATNFTDKNISSIDLKNIKYNIKSIPFHATEQEWMNGSQSNYIPKQGEIIVYDIDENCSYERIKVGDGEKNVNELPFIDDHANGALTNFQSDWNQTDKTAPDYVKNRTHYDETKVLYDLDELGDFSSFEIVRIGPESYYKAPVEVDGINLSDTFKLTVVSQDNVPTVCSIGPNEQVTNDENKIYIERSDSEKEITFYIEAFKGSLYTINNLIISLEEHEGPRGTIPKGIFVGRRSIEPSAVLALSVDGLKQLAPKYIKDMYYETEPVMTVVAPETTINAEPFFYQELNINIELVEGNTYFVTWDGTEYECVCYSYDGGLMIGNNEHWDGSNGNGEPFLIGYYQGTSGVESSEEGEHIFSISIIAPKVHTIKPKYIKDMYYDNGSEEIEILPEWLFEFNESGELNFEFYSETALKEGSTYIVNWDGVQYVCVGKSDGDQSVYIGNQIHATDWTFPLGVTDTFEPFFIYLWPGETPCILPYGTHRVGIVEVAHDITKIDEKYLPILEEQRELIFEGEASNEHNTFLDPSYKLLLGDYVVTVDTSSENVKFVFDYDFSFAETEFCFIASADGIIRFEFSDDNSHHIRIEKVRQVIKDKHLPSPSADWNQNNPHDYGYIANRTHYEEEVTIIPDYEFEFYTISDNGYSYFVSLDQYVQVYPGDKFKVLWDGELYEIDSARQTYIGNLYLLTPDNYDSGEPFLFEFRKYGQRIYTKSEGWHRVTLIKQEIHKIDYKFLPDDMASIPQVEEMISNLDISTSWNDLADKPFGDVAIYSWSEDKEYEEKVPLTHLEAYADFIVKISNDVLTREEIIGKKVYLSSIINGEHHSDVVEYTEENVSPDMGGVYVAEPFYIVTAESVDVDGYVLTKGAWAPSGYKEDSLVFYTEASIVDTKKLDLKYLPKHQHNWETDIVSKPFGENVLLYEWDENKTYEEKVEMPSTALDTMPYRYIVKISDYVPDPSELFGAVSTIYGISEGAPVEYEFVLNEADLQMMTGGYGFLASSIMFITDTNSDLGTGLTRGVWTFSDPLDQNNRITKTIIHVPLKKIDEKYIPDTIARVSDIPDVSAPKTEFILASTTEGSNKKFKITIDDSATLTITEIIEEG